LDESDFAVPAETEDTMPDKNTLKRAGRAKRQGKAPSTQAGEFVREEMEHIREGKHGARSAKQAIAIGLSKARRSGVKLPPPKAGAAPESIRGKAKRDLKKGASPSGRKPAPKRSRATTRALKREGHAAASTRALSRQTRASAASRTKAQRSSAAKKTARTRATTR
jgi:hypothetical protein